MINTLKYYRRKVQGNLRVLNQKLQFKKISVGKDFFMMRYMFITSQHSLVAGNNVYIGSNANIGANVVLGNDILIASYVAFVGGDHRIDNIGSTPIMKSGVEHTRTTVVDDNVWIGHGCIIMAGVHIAEGAVIAAGSVVTRDVPRDTIVAGSPARILRKRKLD